MEEIDIKSRSKQEVSYNPFAHIFEDGANPNARTLRNSLSKKLEDTVVAFAGKQPSEEDAVVKGLRFQLGIFDYLFLTIPYQSKRLERWLDNAKPPFQSFGLNAFISFLKGFFLLLPLKLIDFGFKLARYITLIPFTIVSLPFVGVVHLISKIEGDPLKDTVEHWLQEQQEPENPSDQEDIILDNPYPNQPELDYESVRFEFTRGDGMNSHMIIVHLNQTLENGEKVHFEKNLNLENPEHNNVLEALYALNVNGVAGKIKGLGILGTNTNHRQDDGSDDNLGLLSSSRNKEKF